MGNTCGSSWRRRLAETDKRRLTSTFVTVRVSNEDGSGGPSPFQRWCAGYGTLGLPPSAADIRKFEGTAPTAQTVGCRYDRDPSGEAGGHLTGLSRPATARRLLPGPLGGRQLWAKESSVGIEVPGAVLVAQQVDGYVLPAWPGTSIVHLDLTADDLGAAAERAIALGATLPDQPDPRWRVLLDPAGHPFCLTPFTPESVD